VDVFAITYLNVSLPEKYPIYISRWETVCGITQVSGYLSLPAFLAVIISLDMPLQCLFEGQGLTLSEIMICVHRNISMSIN